MTQPTDVTPSQRMCVVSIRKQKNEPVLFRLRRGLGMQALCAAESTPIEFDCRNADCGICVLRVLAGAENLSPPTEREADFLKAMRADPEERLACQCRVMGDVAFEVEF